MLEGPGPSPLPPRQGWGGDSRETPRIQRTVAIDTMMDSDPQDEEGAWASAVRKAQTRAVWKYLILVASIFFTLLLAFAWVPVQFQTVVPAQVRTVPQAAESPLPMSLTFRISASEAGSLRVDQAVDISLPEHPSPLKGKVTSVESDSSDPSRSLLVEISVENGLSHVAEGNDAQLKVLAGRISFMQRWLTRSGQGSSSEKEP